MTCAHVIGCQVANLALTLHGKGSIFFCILSLRNVVCQQHGKVSSCYTHFNKHSNYEVKSSLVEHLIN